MYLCVCILHAACLLLYLYAHVGQSDMNFVYDVEALGLVKECRELEGAFQWTTYTPTERLVENGVAGVSTLQLKESILEKGRESLLVPVVANYKIERELGWEAVWDAELSGGVCSIRRVQQNRRCPLSSLFGGSLNVSFLEEPLARRDSEAV